MFKGVLAPFVESALWFKLVTQYIYSVLGLAHWTHPIVRAPAAWFAIQLQESRAWNVLDPCWAPIT